MGQLDAATQTAVLIELAADHPAVRERLVRLQLANQRQDGMCGLPHRQPDASPRRYPLRRRKLRKRLKGGVLGQRRSMPRRELRNRPMSSLIGSMSSLPRRVKSCLLVVRLDEKLGVLSAQSARAAALRVEPPVREATVSPLTGR